MNKRLNRVANSKSISRKAKLIELMQKLKQKTYELAQQEAEAKLKLKTTPKLIKLNINH